MITATITLEDLYTEEYAREKNLAPDTIRMAVHGARKFSEYLGFDATVAHLNDETVRSYQTHRVQHDGARPSTVNGELKPLKALWRWAWLKKIVQCRPDVPNLPEPRHERELDPWRFDEMQSLLEECHQARGKVGQVPAKSYWPAFCQTQWEIEERPKVMLALRWADVNWDSGRVMLPADVRGWHRKPRSLYLSPEIRRSLRSIETPKRKLIFGGVTMQEWRVLFRQIVTAAGLSWEKYESSPVAMYRQFAIFRQAAKAVGRTA